VEVRTRRGIDESRRWKALRVRRSISAFASTDRRRPSGTSVSRSRVRHRGLGDFVPHDEGGGESRRWRGLGAVLRKRGSFTDQTANRARSGRGTLRGSDMKCPSSSQVGVNPSGRYRASWRGSHGLVLVDP
jgi:hypothetical protein